MGLTLLVNRLPPTADTMNWTYASVINADCSPEILKKVVEDVCAHREYGGRRLSVGETEQKGIWEMDLEGRRRFGRMRVIGNQLLVTWLPDPIEKALERRNIEYDEACVHLPWRVLLGPKMKKVPVESIDVRRSYHGRVVDESGKEFGNGRGGAIHFPFP